MGIFDITNNFTILNNIVSNNDSCGLTDQNKGKMSKYKSEVLTFHVTMLEISSVHRGSKEMLIYIFKWFWQNSL